MKMLSLLHPHIGRRRLATRQCVLLVLSILFAGSVLAEPNIIQPSLEATTENWRIYDAGLAATPEQQPTWIDSERLLIAGIPLGDAAGAAESESPVNRVFIWKLRGERRPYSIGKAFCYSRPTKFIRIYVGWSDTLVDPNPPQNHGRKYSLNAYKVGSFGQEQLEKKKAYFRQPREESKILTLHNPFTCQLPDPPIYKPILRRFGHLIPRHGHLDFGPNDNTQLTYNYPVTLHRPDGVTVELPFGANARSFHERAVFSIGYRFFEFRNAYFLWNGAASTRLAAFWLRKSFLPAWWLLPDGRTEQTRIPTGPWAEFGVGYEAVLPTKAGFFISILGLPEKNGAYLAQPNGRYVRIMPGWFLEADVSPDGCKVASLYRSNEPRLNWRHYRNKVIDFCVDGKREVN